MRKNPNTYEYQKMRYIERKLYLINIKGGKCEKCGYNKNIAALDFHHRNPKHKRFNLDGRKISNTSLSLLLEECEKCNLLCSNCHREEHYDECEVSILQSRLNDISHKIKSSTRTIIPRIQSKCLDCDVDLTHGYIRCDSCNTIFSRRHIPNENDLRNSISTLSRTECSKKYNVSKTTIRRWIKHYNIE